MQLESGAAASDPAPLFERARRLFSEHRCGFSADRAANNTVNLALAYFHAGDLERVIELLDATDADLPPRVWFWREDLAARLALKRGRVAQALEIYSSLSNAPATRAVTDGVWRVAAGKALAYEAEADRQLALDHYADAEGLLDDILLTVPIAAGRDSFLARRGQTTRRHLALLLELGQSEEALALVRRSRARVLRSLRCEQALGRLSGADRERWLKALTEYEQQRAEIERITLRQRLSPRDEARRLEHDVTRRITLAREVLDRGLSACGDASRSAPMELARRPGDLLLAYHPLPQGWVGFAAINGELTTRRLACVDEADTRAAQYTCLITPFREELARAKRVRILSLGHLNRIDFHALGPPQDVLLTDLPVGYLLDVGGAENPVAPPRRALIVADARGDLQAARDEARIVESALRARGVADIVVLMGKAATASAVRASLKHVDVFHYAGHATYSGDGGWESVLMLGDATEMTVADIFAAEHVPDVVVLSGCDAGRVSLDDAPESLSLANAFAASGARSVVAAVRPVTDSTARDLVAELYAAWTGTQDIGSALRIAQLKLRDRDESADWAAFRLIEP